MKKYNSNTIEKICKSYHKEHDKICREYGAQIDAHRDKFKDLLKEELIRLNDAGYIVTTEGSLLDEMAHCDLKRCDKKQTADMSMSVSVFDSAEEFIEKFSFKPDNIGERYLAFGISCSVLSPKQIENAKDCWNKIRDEKLNARVHAIDMIKKLAEEAGMTLNDLEAIAAECDGCKASTRLG